MTQEELKACAYIKAAKYWRATYFAAKRSVEAAKPDLAAIDAAIKTMRLAAERETTCRQNAARLFTKMAEDK